MRDLVAELEEREIIARIKKARVEAGLTQQQMAELLEVIPRTVQNYESVTVPWNLLNQIAKITGKTQEWLLHGEPPDLTVVNGKGDQLDRIEAALKDLAEQVEDLRRG